MFFSKKLKSFDNVNHCFFSKNGGVSHGVYNSLNCGLGSADKKKNVYVTFNGKTFVLNKFSDQATKDLWVDNYFEKGAKKDVEGTSRSQYYSWTDWYQEETGKFGLFIQRDKNILQAEPLN